MSRLPRFFPSLFAVAPVSALTLVLFLSGAAEAHDFWLRPSSYHLDAPRPIAVQLLVGDHFRGVPYARNPAHIAAFVVVGPDGRRDVDGENGVDPAGLLDLLTTGTHIVGYRSRWSRVELEAEKFEQYLEHEGLDHVLRSRHEAGQQDTPGREVFSRCAKAILCVGDPETAHVGFATPLGMRLELVPETNPAHLDGTARPSIDVRLVFEGRPLAGAIVTAHHADAADVAIAVRTDEQGRASLALPYAGEWMLNTVHMLPAPDGADADWESLWASLSFSVPAPRGEGA